MTIIRSLGEGYYGVEASEASVRKESFLHTAEKFERAMSIPDADIPIRSHTSDSNEREVGFSYSRKAARSEK